MNGKEILEQLEIGWNGLETLRYSRRYDINGDNKLKKIHWVLGNFDCTYGIAKRLVEKANMTRRL